MNDRRFGPVENAEALGVVEGTWSLDSYEDRDGYDPTFLGGAEIPLPTPGRHLNTVATLKEEAKADGLPNWELRYRHFSVAFDGARQLPLFSAVNIDGERIDRDTASNGSWRRDPRIPSSIQNLREGYGHAHKGFFSRGHMTRRLDPNWGEKDKVLQADADTFHITNAAPQQQGFNSPIWLRLEDYVIDNAGAQDLRISVFTGPVLREDDPLYYGRRVPLDFWKIVLFLDPRSGGPSCIGYRRSQAKNVPSAQGGFIFGNFEDCQVPVAWIAQATGLQMKALIEVDVMRGADPRMWVRLGSLEDLYLRR